MALPATGTICYPVVPGGSGVDVHGFGCHIGPSGLVSMFCLADTTSGGPAPTPSLFRTQLQRGLPYCFVCHKTDKVSDAGHWIYHVAGTAYDYLHARSLADARMRLIGPQRDLWVDPISLSHFTEFRFEGRVMSFDQNMVTLPAGFLGELLDQVTRLIFGGSADNGLAAVNVMLDGTAGPRNGSAGNECQVPSWCFGLLRTYLTHYDPSLEGVRLWEYGPGQSVAEPLRRLLRHMRSYQRKATA